MQSGTARRAGALAALGAFALCVAATRTASAVDLPGATSATLGWTAAAGPVAGYSVYVSRNGSTPSEPEQRVASPRATVAGALGDSLIVWVEAYDASAQAGPASPNSDLLRFVAAAGAPPDASVSPASISASTPQGKSPASQTISVRNAGGGTLSYAVTSSAGWLAVSPASGTATTETDTLTLSFSTAGLAMGSYAATITVRNTQTQAAKTVAVTLTVAAPGPILSAEPAAIVASALVGQNAPAQTLTIRNAGSGTLSYVVSDSASWLTIATPTGTSTGESDGITLGFASSTLAAGTYGATISVTASGATGSPKTIPVTLAVLAPLPFEVSPDRVGASVAFGHSPPAQTFTIRNASGGSRPYSIASDASWVSADPRVGSSSGETDTITVRFATASLAPGEHVATLRVLTTGAVGFALPVTLRVRPPPGDLDGEGSSDLFLWGRSTGRLSVLSHVFGPQLGGGQITSGLPSDWQLLLTGDYDADGKADLLWRSRSSGAIVVCLMNGLAMKACGSPISVSSSFTLLGAADFDGDARADVSFRDGATGAVVTCFMNGLATAFCTQIASYPPSSRVVASGDHDADGHADLVVQDPANWTLRTCSVVGASAGTCTAAYALPGAEVVATGDYDGDGAADLLWLLRASGQLWLGFPRASGAGAFRYLGAVPAGIEIVGSLDLDADGRSDVVLRDATTGVVTVWMTSASGLARETVLGPLGTDFTLGGSSPAQ